MSSRLCYRAIVVLAVSFACTCLLTLFQVSRNCQLLGKEICRGGKNFGRGDLRILRFIKLGGKIFDRLSA